MAEAGSFFLAEAMLWLMYIVVGVAVIANIVVGVAVIATIVSAVRSYWLNNRR